MLESYTDIEVSMDGIQNRVRLPINENTIGFESDLSEVTDDRGDYFSIGE